MVCRRLSIVFLFFLLIPITSYAVPNATPTSPILFEDNFDMTTDWRSKQTMDTIAFPNTRWDTCTTTCPPDKGIAPSGWAGYRASRSLFTTPVTYPNPFSPPDGVSTPTIQRDTLVIDSENAYGGSGKSLKYNVENVGDTQTGWSAGSMYVWLGDQGYSELRIRYKMKYNTGWQWRVASAQPQIKTIRLVSFNGDINTEDPTNTQTGSCKERLFWIPDVYFNQSFPTAGTHLVNSILTSSQYIGAPTYNCNGYGANTYASFIFPIQTDTNWHTYEFHAKLNSAPGVADGLWEISVDGATSGSGYVKVDNYVWIASGGSMTPKWNWFMFLDNVYNQAQPFNTNPETQILADDIIIYEPLNSSHSLWAASPQDGRLPLNYTIGNTAGGVSRNVSGNGSGGEKGSFERGIALPNRIYKKSEVKF